MESEDYGRTPGTAKRSHAKCGGMDTGRHSAFVVPMKQGKSDRDDPVEGRKNRKGAPDYNTAGGKHGRDIELGSRVNEMPTDSRFGSAKPTDGSKSPGSDPTPGARSDAFRSFHLSRSEGVIRGTGCGNSARPDLWESRVGNYPGRPSQSLRRKMGVLDF